MPQRMFTPRISAIRSKAFSGFCMDRTYSIETSYAMGFTRRSHLGFQKFEHVQTRCGPRNHGAKFGVVVWWSNECKNADRMNICFMTEPVRTTITRKNLQQCYVVYCCSALQHAIFRFISNMLNNGLLFERRKLLRAMCCTNPSKQATHIHVLDWAAVGGELGASNLIGCPTAIYLLYCIVYLYPSNCHVINIFCDVGKGLYCHSSSTRTAAPAAASRFLPWCQYPRFPPPQPTGRDS